MPSKLPRVLGLDDLLRLRKPLRERPAALVYFTDKEFSRLLGDAVELKWMPRVVAPLARFEPWPDGGMVPERCASPPGFLCAGQWTPAGPEHGSGAFFECRCHKTVVDPDPLPLLPCRLKIDPVKRFTCVGNCQAGRTCRLAFFRDPNTGVTTLDCRCRVQLQP
jgi:hypothetical protein